MSIRRIWVFAALAVVVLAALAALAVQDGAPPPSAPLGNAAEPGSAEPPVTPREPAVVEAPAAPVQDLAPEPAENEDAWTFVGRVEPPLGDTGIFGRVTQGAIELKIYALDPREASPRAHEYEANPDADGAFRLPAPAEGMPCADPAAALWECRLRLWSDDEASVPRDYAARKPRPSPESLQGLVKPAVHGRVLDFGVLRLPPGDNFRVATGRVLTATGLPVCTARENSLGLNVGGDSGAFDFQLGRDGRFAVPLRLAASDEMTALWTLDLDFGNPTPDCEDIVLPRPLGRGHVLDFGDITLPGAVIEFHVFAPDIPPEPPRGDAYLAGGDAPRVQLGLSGTDASEGWIEIPLSAPLSRIVVREGRWKWSAELDRASAFALPLSGVIVIRDGATERVELNFARMATVPVRVVDGEGKPLPAPFHDIHATITWPDGRTWTTHWRRAGEAPVLPDLVTVVKARVFMIGAGEVSGEARLGDRELVLTFGPNEMRNEVEVQVTIPPLPLGLGMDSVIALVHFFREEAGTSGTRVILKPGEPAIATHSLYARDTWKVELRGGGVWGYPDGVFSGPVTFTVPEKGPFKVELPAIEQPPWGLRAGDVVVDLRIGGEPGTVRGVWEYRGLTRTWGYAHGQQVISFQSVREDGNPPDKLLLPVALLTPGRVPLTLIPPQTDWGTAYLRLHLPARVNLRLTRRGEPPMDFTAELESEAVSSSCGVANSRAALWAPAGAATLRVKWLDTEIHRRQVVVRDGQTLDIDLALDEVRVSFTQEGETRPDWSIVRIDDGRATQHGYVAGGSERLLPQGLYRLTPDPPFSPSLAVELDLREGKDLDFRLPALSAVATTDVLVRLSMQQVKDVTSSHFEYYLDHPGRDRKTPDFAASAVGLDSRLTPDGVRVSGLPLGAAVILRGALRFGPQDGAPCLVIPPTELIVAENVKLEPRLLPAREGTWLVSRIEWICENLKAGCWLPVHVQGVVPVGAHEVMALGNDGQPRLRYTLAIPAGEGEFKMPEDLRAAMKDAGLEVR